MIASDGICQPDEPVGIFVVIAEARVRADPDSAPPVLRETIYRIVDQAGGIAVVVAKHLESVSVIPVQPVSRSEPEEPARVLVDAPDSALGEAVVDGEMR